MEVNRLVALATVGLGVATAIAAPLANLDWSSTAGVLGGLVVVLGVAQKWLTGWQEHEKWLREQIGVDEPGDWEPPAPGATSQPGATYGPGTPPEGTP